MFEKIRRVSQRLGPDKMKRAVAALRNYGVRECVRRGVARLRGQDAVSAEGGQRLVVTNESYYPANVRRGFECRKQVSFVTAPSRDNITQIAIRTVAERPGADARLHLEVRDGDEMLVSGSTGTIADGAETIIRFPVVRGVFGHPLRFTIRAEGQGNGILVNADRVRDGFTVDGGGSVACRVYGLDGEDAYQEWISWNEPSADALDAQRKMKQDATAACVVMLESAADAAAADRFMTSMEAQTYARWHVYLTGTPQGSAFRDAVAARYPGRCTSVAVSPGLDTVSAVLAAAPGTDCFVFAAADDTLAPHALFEYMSALQDGADFVYSDEDVLDPATGQRSSPFFKPDYSPNLLLSYNYIGSFFGLTRALAEQLHSDSTYDSVLQAVDAAHRTEHIPDVLVHVSSDRTGRSVQPGDRASVEKALHRRGIPAAVRQSGPDAGHFDIDYALPESPPHVSILIPSHNEAAMLRACVSSILDKTSYPNYRIIVIENNSTDEDAFAYYKEVQKDPRVQVLEWNHPFNFAAINNWAVQQTNGELLLFLNNDTTVIADDWLDRMTALCARPDVGAVGAKLLYPDDTIQHGGVVMRMMGIAGHAHHGAPASSSGSFWRLEVPFDVSGATGACLMIPRDVFDKVGGFDEQYVLAFNDVDICLKIRELGLSILFEPRASLYHYESKTRGYEVTPAQQKRFRNEQIIWIRKWLDKYPGDPFYNPNLRYDTCAFDTAPEKRGASVRRTAKPYDELIDAQIEPL